MDLTSGYKTLRFILQFLTLHSINFFFLSPLLPFLLSNLLLPITTLLRAYPIPFQKTTMKLPAWTKKVFAPVFSSSPSTTSSSSSIISPATTTSYPTITLTPSTSSCQTPNDNLAKFKGSFQSYLSFSKLPNVKRHIPLLGVPDTTANSSTASQTSAILFNRIRDPRAPSSPQINKTSSSIIEGSIKPAAMDLERNDNDNNGDDSYDEDVSGSPTTTTIYYYPPRPKKQPTELSTQPLPSSPSSSDKSMNTNISPRFTKSDPEVRCLRHIDPISSAACASSPEVNHLQQHYQHPTHPHQPHLYHDKDCQFACHSTIESIGRRPTSRRNTDPRQQDRDNLLLPHNSPQTHPPSSGKPGSIPSPSATSPALSLPKLKIPGVAPPFFNPPVHYQVRRSSANYSLEALKNKKRKNNSSNTGRPTSQISDTTIAGSTSSDSSGTNSSGRPQHSEDIMQELRELIHCINQSESPSSPSSSTSELATTSIDKVQITAKSCAPAVPVSNNDVPAPAAATTAAASNLPSSFSPCNSRLISKATQVLASDANTSTTTTTTTVTTITTAPTITENKFEQLILKIDTLALEVEIMKQQHSYTRNGNSDAPHYAKKRNKVRNLSTASLPLPSTLSIKATTAKNNNASSLTFSFPPPPPLPINNNNNNNPMPPSDLPTLSLFRISGNNKPIMHHYSNDINSTGMACLQNLPPPPSERPPSPPTYSSSSSSSSPYFSSSNSFYPSQRGDTNSFRDKSRPSLPSSKIPIPRAPRHQRPTSSFNRSFTVLFPSPPSTPSFAPTYARAATTNYAGSMNNVHSKRLTMTTATTTTTTDDIKDVITLPSTSATPVDSSAVAYINHSDDEDAISTAPFMNNDNNDKNNDNTSIIKGQDQARMDSESTIISRAVSKTPAHPTTPPPPPASRPYLTITTTAANNMICEQTMVGMIGPPRRPPRPPQLSVDMKEILLLMDSRLGGTVVVPLPRCVGTGDGVGADSGVSTHA